MNDSLKPTVQSEPVGPARDRPVDRSLLFAGVFLLTTGPEGPTAVPSLRLRMDEMGICLEKADETHVWSSPWSEIEELSASSRSKLSTGGHGVVVAITVRGQHQETHQFVVPTRRPDNLEQSITSISALYGVGATGIDLVTDASVAGRPGTSSNGEDESSIDSDASTERIPIVLTVAVVLATAAVVAILLLAAGNIINL